MVNATKSNFASFPQGRVKPKTAGKLRAAAKQKLEEERRLRPQRKRLLVGKVLDDLAQQL